MTRSATGATRPGNAQVPGNQVTAGSEAGGTSGASPAPTKRQAAKERRRQQILDSAKKLFARQGFRAVSIDDIGAGAGISGPAVYRHFDSKEALLAELLVGISKRLHAGMSSIVAAHSGAQPREAMEDLLAFHVEFAVNEPELIRIQDRDFEALQESDRKRVRRLQREYMTGWEDVLIQVHPDLEGAGVRVLVQAVIGMLNSTPYVVRRLNADVIEQHLSDAARAALRLG
ncbi:TetR/AcrR family transcriptional regulator [Brevibacterium sp. HMSC24B04]|nr:TetR/AcrR family transcriptional regulator [Brevibacterium sp. HMSC24B04]